MADPIFESMFEFIAEQAARSAKTRKDQNALVTSRTEEVANSRPTPTVAELNAIVASPGGAYNLAAPVISQGKTLRPAAVGLLMQRKFPRTS